MYNDLYLRPVTESDMKLLFDWRNVEECRKNSFSTKLIDWEDHKNWFINLLNNSNQRAYIFMVKNNPVGQIRLAKSGDLIEISYSIDKKERGKGYGKLFLTLAEKEMPKCEFIGQVKSENIASQKVFEALGYDRQDIIIYKKKSPFGGQVASIIAHCIVYTVAFLKEAA